MKNFLTMLILSIPVAVNGQYTFKKELVRPQILSIANKIAKEESFDLMHVYSGVIGTTAQYDRFEELIQLGATDELKELMNHPNQYVRVYSFLGLANKQYSTLDSLVLYHKDDRAVVLTTSGCVGYHTTVIELLLEITSPNCWDIERAKLTTEQFKILYSKVYDRKIKVGLVSDGEIDAELEAEFLAMKEKTKTKDTELNSFRGFGAVLDQDKTRILVFESDNDFKIYDLSTGQIADTFSIKTKNKIRADITYFTNDKLIYLGAWDNYKKNKSVFWVVDLASKEKKLITCKQTPFGCNKMLTESYVYKAPDTDTDFYVGGRNKCVFEDRYVQVENGLIKIYKKEW